jgi:hypothetical protein
MNAWSAAISAMTCRIRAEGAVSAWMIRWSLADHSRRHAIAW